MPEGGRLFAMCIGEARCVARPLDSAEFTVRVEGTGTCNLHNLNRTSYNRGDALAVMIARNDEGRTDP